MIYDVLFGGGVISAVLAAFGALWAYIRQVAQDGREREQKLTQALANQSVWQRETMHNTLQQVSSVMLGFTEAIRSNTAATEKMESHTSRVMGKLEVAIKELREEVHTLRIGAEEREKKRAQRENKGGGDEDHGGINL